jgi:hypothetical protein
LGRISNYFPVDTAPHKRGNMQSVWWHGGGGESNTGRAKWLESSVVVVRTGWNSQNRYAAAASVSARPKKGCRESCDPRLHGYSRGVRSRHIIPVPTDHIMKVAASHLSLSQPLDLSPLAPLLSANHSPSTLGSIPLGPIPLSLSARFLSVVCALPERCLRASSNYLCTSLLH